MKNNIKNTLGNTLPIIDRSTASIMVHVGAVLRQQKLLTILAHHPDTQVRIKLTGKRNCKSNLHLHYLATDKNEIVRTSLARSKKKISGEILALLATDSNEKIRYLVACRREELPIPIYYALLKDGNTRILTALSMNKYSPQWVIDRLIAQNVEGAITAGIKMNSNISQETEIHLYLKDR